ncbi:MAG TPA: response regulator [Pilimelia sp.]|nr:response regulator [Pilimelia sp.]
MSMTAMPPNATVLVFDDEDDLRDVMCRMLQRRGFQTLSSGTPEDAVAVCRQHQGDIHVLLADLGMPHAIGVGLARQACQIRPDLRVIYVSGLPHEAAVRQGIVDENAAVVQKPFTTDGLVAAVCQALDPTGRPSASSHAG